MLMALTPGFGVWECRMFKTVSDSILFGSRKAAELNNVGLSTVYKWRKECEISR